LGGIGGSAGIGGSSPSEGGTSTAGKSSGGAGKSGGRTSSGKGGTTGGTGDAGQAGSNEAGQSGSNEGGQSGSAQGGVGGSGGTQGKAGHGGTTSAGGTTSSGGTSTGGTAAEAGAAGAGGPELFPCTDGCAILNVPPSANFQQFFTINLDLNNGIDLSDSVFTAHVHAVDFTGSSEAIQFYASATGFAFYGNTTQVPLSTLVNGGTLTMDLTSTAGWDNTKVISFGFLLHGASVPKTVQVLVEDITVAVKADPSATPKVGPWLFTQEADVNETPAEQVPSTYSATNIIFGNPFQAVTGAQAVWQGPFAGP
jgi:hypothetical protein